ncbi:MAG: hypothetical protein ACJAYC_003339 [Halieaceae bacterium]|jgi:hypothetical protein
MLLAIGLHKDFINVEGIAIASVLSFQSGRIDRAKLDAPETDCLSADGDASFSEEIFDITVAAIEPVVEPDFIGNNVRRETVSFISIHPMILSISVSLLVSTNH